MRKLLPVGAYVLVRDPGIRDEYGHEIRASRGYVGRVIGYSLFRDKYAISTRIAGWDEWIWSTREDYVPTIWCEEMAEADATRLPDARGD